ncbi:MAG: ABC transporter permease [Treponema sp.]|nr:ABC transporter permease [Treponema sp.]
MNLYLFGTILNMATVLMTAGCGSFLSVKGGNFNLGGEGQIYAGGFIAALSLCACKNLPSFVAVPLCFFAASLFSALMTFVSAVLKRYRGVDVLLSSFLISAGCIPLIDSLIAGKFRGNTNNLLATEFIPKNFRFPSILPPSPLDGTFIVAILLCVALYFFMNRTLFGQHLAIYGISPDFAIYSGFSSLKLDLVSVSVSGFLHGAAGFFSVAGTYFACHPGFYSGMGWNALSVALISMRNPLLIIPSALILAGLTAGASQFSLMHNYGFDMGSMLQGVILFVIVLFTALWNMFENARRRRLHD